MKILFLDIDGVILTLRTAVAHQFRGWSNAAPDEVLCKLLRQVCGKGVKLVISSTWRAQEEACKDKLKECRLLKHLHEDWRTIRVSANDGHCRPAEITEWLSRHPEVEDYLIADDASFKWTPEQNGRWLRCYGENGMMAREMLKLAKWAGLRS